MKNIYRLVFVLFTCLAAMPSCQERFEEEYGSVELDYNKITVKADAGKYTFMVYCSGDWNITFDGDADWVTLDKPSGSGVTMVNIEFAKNIALKRSVNMIVSGGGESRIIPVTQNPSVDKVSLEFLNQESIQLANCAGKVVAKLRSNMQPEFIESQDLVSSESWITECEIKNGQSASDSEYLYDVAFSVPENETGAERRSTISLQFSDSDGKIYKAEVSVIQSSEPGELILSERAILTSAAKEYAEEVKGGLLIFSDFAEKIECSVTGSDFIQNARVDGGMLFYDVLENETEESREGEITLVYGDNNASASLKVIQRESRVKTIYEISTLDDLVAWNKAACTAGDLVILNNDIDCTGYDASADWKTNIFNGKFEGNNHVIDNFVIEKAGETAFFARVIDSGSVSDLTFGPGCSFTAKSFSTSLNKNTYAASLAAFVGGNASFNKVINKGSVKVSSEATGGTGANFLGGICGFFNSKGSLDDCENHGTVTNEATVTGWTCLGGIVGCVSVKDAATALNRNKNTADVKNDVALTAALALGGVSGRVNTNASLAMAACENSGNLTNTSNATGIYMAGILGYVDGKTISVELKDCKTAGILTITNTCTANKSKTALGGFVSVCHANVISNCHSTMSITNEFTGNTGNTFVGGLAGQIESGVTTKISGCSVNSEISAGGAGNDGMLVGRLTHQPAKGSETTVTNVFVKGSFNGNALTDNNYTSYLYGTQEFSVDANEVKYGVSQQ